VLSSPSALRNGSSSPCLSRAFFGAKAGSQPGRQPISHPGGFHQSAWVIVCATYAPHKTLDFRSRENPVGLTNRNFGVRADQTDARTHLNKTPSASVGRGDFILVSRAAAVQLHPRFSCPLPRSSPPPSLSSPAHPRAPSDARFSERGARARASAFRWRALRLWPRRHGFA